MNLITETMKMLTAAAAKHAAVAVAYSDGKDARVVLDLAMRAGFKRLEAYFMYFVPDLELMNVRLREAEARYPGLRIHQLPSWGSMACIKAGVYRDPLIDAEAIPKFTARDVYRLIMDDLKVSLVLTGEKAADSMRRKLLMKTAMASWEEVAWPIRNWTNHDVVAYLAMRKIPNPEQIGAGATSGIGLKTNSLLHLYRHHPDDFKKLLEYFPYAEAAIWREKFYGAQ